MQTKLTLVSIIIAQGVIIGYLIIAYRNSRRHPPCDHRWRKDKITDVYDITFGRRSHDRTEVRCQCTKCGVWKKFKL